jgi:hypothetical protein
MKLHVRCISTGLIPMYDEDHDAKKRLKIGETYKVTITKARNYELHKKYFGLINCAWEYLPEYQNEFYGNTEKFRKTCEIAAGHCETVYSLERKEWVDSPKSISFDKMDEFAFRGLYDSVRHVIFSTFLRHITIEEFEDALINF